MDSKGERKFVAMRVVCLVPSWTETLCEWGVEVVGRTRYCIHPAGRVAGIPVVGGTKTPDFAKIRRLAPDLVIVDREENNKNVVESVDVPVHDSHVRRVENMPMELARMRDAFVAVGARRSVLKNIEADQDRWRAILGDGGELLPHQTTFDAKALPGVLSWIRPPEQDVANILYVIWKDPWMVVSRATYIGSVLEAFGHGQRLPHFDKSYPEIALEEWLSPATLLLFSSEPYPFAKRDLNLAALGPNPMAVVDGESYSWFGLRGLRFLERSLRSR